MGYSESEIKQEIASRTSLKVAKMLSSKRVAIAGCGGIGSNVAAMLARSFVGYIKLFDYDIIEYSNLNRQHFFIDQVGIEKAKALQDNIAHINPFIRVKAESLKLCKDNILSQIDNSFDLIIEAFDNAEEKSEFIEACLTELERPFIIGCSGMAGSGSYGTITVKKLGKRCLIVGDFECGIEDNDILLSSRVNIVASIMANEAIRHLLNGEEEDEDCFEW